MKLVSIVYMTGLIGLALSGCAVQKGIRNQDILSDTIRIPGAKSDLALEVHFEKGDAHNHPTFAIWIEDLEENYLQTLFVTKSLGTGIYGHGRLGSETWDSKPGPQNRPATLPYWLHKRSDYFKVPLLPDSTSQVVDGYTGATPIGGFVIKTAVRSSLPSKFRLLLEINQPWDWNDYWTNALVDDLDYKTSCQPSLIYSVTVDMNNPGEELHLNPVGHGHFAGKDGKLYTDLSTMTTALHIINKATVKLTK